MSYDIEPDAFEVPSLPGSVNVAADEEDAQERLGRDLLAAAKHAVGRRGIFHLALSGGGTPMPFYRRLMIDPLFREMPWSNTHLWIVDERRAPFDSDTNNFKHITHSTTSNDTCTFSGRLHIYFRACMSAFNSMI